MTRALRIGAGVCLVLLGSALDAGDRIGMKIRPSMCFAPADVDVRVTIEPHADNRSLEITADSVEFFRSSLIPLEGERAPKVFAMRLRGLPGGEYEIEAILRDAGGGLRGSTRRNVNVIASGADD